MPKCIINPNLFPVLNIFLLFFPMSRDYFTYISPLNTSMQTANECVLITQTMNPTDANEKNFMNNKEKNQTNSKLWEGRLWGIWLVDRVWVYKSKVCWFAMSRDRNLKKYCKMRIWNENFNFLNKRVSEDNWFQWHRNPPRITDNPLNML